MSNVVKKSSLGSLKEEMDDVLLTSLQIEDDFVWIENTSHDIIPQEDNLNSNCEDVAETTNVAQHDTNTENHGSPEECQIQYDAAETENRTINLTESDRELLVEQQYWEQREPVVQKYSSCRPKYPASKRLTVKQLNNIATGKANIRDPSYYKFDISTTNTLKLLLDKKIVGPYHNVLGNGNNSVVIHARRPDFDDGHGVAVKIYKLGYDVKKNNATFKRAQREYEHLQLLGPHCFVPCVTHIVKNIIVFHFVGAHQESTPSMSSLPSEYSKDLYGILVKQMDLWYTKFNIVHGKLCTKNIRFDIITDPYWLRYSETLCRPQIIGWGHSVRRDHPRALVKLMRDCHFVTNFFKRRDVPVKSTEELFKFITGLEKISSKVLDVINEKDLWQEGCLTNPNRQAQA